MRMGELVQAPLRGVFGVGGSNGAISGFAKFNTYVGKTMRQE